MVLTLAPRSHTALIAPRTVIELVIAGDEMVGLLAETLESNRFDVRVHRLSGGAPKLEPGHDRPSAIVIALSGARGANLLAATLCRQIRENDALIPIVCVSGPASAGSKSQVLEAGADDLITLPLDEIEFLARLAAHLRKARAVAALLNEQSLPDGARRWFGEVEVDVNAREVRVAGQAVHLGRLEFNLVDYLSRNAGTACSWQQITNELYGFDAEVFEDRIEALVRRVRANLGAGSSRSGCLVSVPGYGFRWLRNPGPIALLEAIN